MKKSLFIMALGAIALTSCSQDEIIEVQKDAISFAVFTENTSRATPTTASDISSFKVYGYVGDATYIDGLTATKSGSNFTVGDGYYWPQAAVDFYCLHSTSDLSLVKETKTLSADYTVNSTHADDLLYSVLMNQSKPAGGVATLNFRHALSMIQFKVASLGTYGLNVEVSKIALKNVKQTGKYTLPYVTTSPWLDKPATDTDANHDQAGDVDTGSRGTWTLGNTLANYEWENMSLSADASSGDATSTSSSDAFFLMPQEFTSATPADVTDNADWSNAFFEITCKIKKNDVLLYEGNVAIPAASTDVVNADAKTYKWKEGYKYLYTMTFGKGGGYVPGTDDPVLVPVDFTITVDQFQNTAEQISVQASASN